MAQKIKILKKENYLSFIRNSIDSSAYKNFYIAHDKGKKDILENGNLSCAYFVSSVLFLFDLINKRHITVEGTIKDLLKSGWKKGNTEKMKPGDIIVWEAEKGKTGNHKHIGFYIGEKKAISNSSKRKKIYSHHPTFNSKRKIESVLTHRSLK